MHKLKYYKKYLIIFLFSITFSFSIFSIQFEHLTREKGLPHNSVNCIFQDQVGSLWFGTDDGLCRYEGYDLKIYRQNWGNNNITVINQDPEGTLWIGTQNGLNQFQREKREFMHFGESNGLINNSVMSITEDKQNQLWIGTENGISCFNIPKNKFINYDDSDGLVCNVFNRNASYKSLLGHLYPGDALKFYDLMKINKKGQHFTAHFRSY